VVEKFLKGVFHEISSIFKDVMFMCRHSVPSTISRIYSTIIEVMPMLMGSEIALKAIEMVIFSLLGGMFDFAPLLSLLPSYRIASHPIPSHPIISITGNDNDSITISSILSIILITILTIIVCSGCSRKKATITQDTATTIPQQQ
jgi:hypothetical protein